MIIVNVIQTIFLLVFLVLFWTVLGIAVTHIFRKGDSNYSLTTLLALGMTAWFCAGTFLLSLGYFKFWTFALVFFGSLWVARKHLKSNWLGWIESFKSFLGLFYRTSRWENILIVFIIIFVILSMVAFVAPLESDGVGYYLPIAKLWADSGLIQMLRGYDDFSAVGAFAEVQMATIYLMDGEFLARGFSALFPLLIATELYKFSQKLKLSLQGFLIQVVALYSSLCVVLIMYSGKIDLFSAWLGLLSIYYLFYDVRIFKAGFFLGAACVAKLSLLGPMFFVAVTALVYRSRRFNWRQVFLNGLKLAVPFLFVLFWQLLKNQILFDNALAPFIGNRIGEERNWYAPETIERIKMLYPLVWFFGDYWGQLGSFSILVLMFLPFVWLGYKLKRYEFPQAMQVVPYWCVMFFLGMTLWFLIRPSFVAPRYIMGFFLIVFPMMGLGYDWFVQKNQTAQVNLWLVRAMVVIFCIYSVGMYLRSPISPVRAYYALQTPLSKCKIDGPDCVAMEILNETVEPGSRVLQLMYESYWLRPDLIQTLRGFYELDGIEKLTADEKWKKIVSRQFKYILLKASTHQEWAVKIGLSEVPPWIELKQIFNYQGVAAWKIEVNRAHPKAPVDVPEVELKHTHNGWLIQDSISL